MKEIILAIDIGHNVPYDRGAVGIRKEDELNMLVGQELITLLKDRGIKVVYCTPSSASSHYNSLHQRVAKANNSGADLFISIHHNACPGGYGSEVLYIKSNLGNGLSSKVGIAILKELELLGLRNRGLKERKDLYVIKNTIMPAIIVECAFVDSTSDMKDYNPKKAALAIYKGICTTFAIDEEEHTNNKQYYIVKKGGTLWRISRKFGTTVDELVDMNGIKNKNFISIGQKLRVR